MKIIQEVSNNMQEILEIEGNKLSKETGFMKRKSKMTGSLFTQTLVFSWMSNPKASLSELSQVAMSLGVKISPQGIEKRFREESSKLLKGVLEKAVTKVISRDEISIKTLNKFSSVNVLDTSTISLPKELENVWKGCGGSKGMNSALKIGVRLDLVSGELKGPLLEHGKVSDNASLINKDIPEEGGLRIADLGFFSINKLKEINEKKAFFISRLKIQTNLYTNQDEKIDLLKLLKNKTILEKDIFLSEQKLPVRLIAIKVSESEIKNRMKKLKEESRKSCREINKLREELIDFNIYLTNIPEDMVTFKEIIILTKVRWQIELLFKLWKNEGKIDEWRTLKPFRILTEVYAKLLAMVIQHWIILISCWSDFDRSLTKSVKIIQKNISILIRDFNQKQFDNIESSLEYISSLFGSGIKINKRKKKPSTSQFLNKPESLNYSLG